MCAHGRRHSLWWWITPSLPSSLLPGQISGSTGAKGKSPVDFIET